MRTLSTILKETRINKEYSLEDLEKETKIKKSFLRAIEKEDWDSLPEFPVVIGFVKSIASSLGVDTKKAVALLRRDYPPKSISINPKPDIENKFFWSPRFTFLVGLSVLLVLVLGYLSFQYLKFVSPPTLSVFEPKDGQVIKTREVTVLGKTDPGATVKINNQAVLVEENGNFNAKIEIFEGTKEIEIKSISRSGKETALRRKIKPELE